MVWSACAHDARLPLFAVVAMGFAGSGCYAFHTTDASDERPLDAATCEAPPSDAGADATYQERTLHWGPTTHECGGIDHVERPVLCMPLEFNYRDVLAAREAQARGDRDRQMFSVELVDRCAHCPERISSCHTGRTAPGSRSWDVSLYKRRCPYDDARCACDTSCQELRMHCPLALAEALGHEDMIPVGRYTIVWSQLDESSPPDALRYLHSEPISFRVVEDGADSTVVCTPVTLRPER